MKIGPHSSLVAMNNFQVIKYSSHYHHHVDVYFN